MARFNPSRHSYGAIISQNVVGARGASLPVNYADAGGAQQGISSGDISYSWNGLGGYSYDMMTNGTITIHSPSKGTSIAKPGASNFLAIVAERDKYGTNMSAAKTASVSAANAVAVQAGQAVAPVVAAGDTAVSITEHVWFWPVAILTPTAMIAAAVIFWPHHVDSAVRTISSSASGALKAVKAL